jgi:hypothetical protein
MDICLKKKENLLDAYGYAAIRFHYYALRYCLNHNDSVITMNSLDLRGFLLTPIIEIAGSHLYHNWLVFVARSKVFRNPLKANTKYCR